jgi:hypothetical protein
VKGVEQTQNLISDAQLVVSSTGTKFPFRRISMRVTVHPIGSISRIVSVDVVDGEKEFSIVCGDLTYEFRRLKDNQVECQVSPPGAVPELTNYVVGVITYDIDKMAPSRPGEVNFLTFEYQIGDRLMTIAWELPYLTLRRALDNYQMAAIS